MIRKLFGAWIGLSLMWWYGGWEKVTRPNFEAPLWGPPAPSIKLTDATFCMDGCVPCEDTPGSGAIACEYQEGTLAYKKQVDAFGWRIWFELRWASGELPLYFFFPFIALVFGAAIFWTLGRFKDKPSRPE